MFENSTYVRLLAGVLRLVLCTRPRSAKMRIDGIRLFKPHAFCFSIAAEPARAERGPNRRSIMTLLESHAASELQKLEQAARRFGPAMVTYLNYHRPRFIFLARLIDGLILSLGQGGKSQPVRLLDIGPSFETQLIPALWPEVRLDTMGMYDARFPNSPGGKHIELDLNDIYFEDKRPKVEPYSIIILAEVIEHLYTAPSQIFTYLATCLRPGGYLIVQTPNAATLPNRVKLLLGRNPFEMIRESRANPGHYREYTRRELIELGGANGLSTVRTFMSNYSLSGTVASRAWRWLAQCLPGNLRKCITIVYRRDS